MTHQPVSSTPQFYLTAPQPCPYLQHRFERKVFTHLVGDRAPDLNDLLTQGGFRRSQNIAYRPACETCRSCVSVRVLAQEFRRSANMDKIWRKNADLVGAEYKAEPSSEQYSLFRKYLEARHGDGGMADMSVLDFSAMVDDNFVDSRLVEYRVRSADGEAGELVAAVLVDILGDGISLIYSFYDPDQTRRGLGTFMILDNIARVKRLGLPYLYLGYWVQGSRKMDYKSRFLPQERLTPEGWLLHR